MRRTWVWILAVGGAALLAVWVASLHLSGIEELSSAAGPGSFVLTATDDEVTCELCTGRRRNSADRTTVPGQLTINQEFS